MKNKYVVNKIGKEELYHLISVANVLYSENPLKVEEEWINDYELKDSAFYEPSYVIAKAYQTGGF